MTTKTVQKLVSKYHSLLKGKLGFLKKYVIAGLTQGKYNMNLEQSLVQERKYSEKNEDMSKEQSSQLQRSANGKQEIIKISNDYKEF